MQALATEEERGVSFYEGEFLVKTLETKEDLTQAYRLRHRIFAERLKWVPERADRLEADMYDTWSTSIGIFADDTRLLGLVRMTHAPVPFMLESEFRACLVGNHHVRKETDTAEITRLAVDPEIGDRGLSARLMKAIFKGMYQWCLLHDVRYTYMVVEYRLLRVVQRMGWPCHAIGEPVALPPAEMLSIGGLLDLDQFRSQALTCRPGMLDWLTTTTPVPDPTRVHRPAMGQESDVAEYAELAENRLLIRAA